MNKKALKKQLQSYFLSDVPDVFSTLSIDNIIIEKRVERNKNAFSLSFTVKRTLRFALTFVIVSLLILFSFSQQRTTTSVFASSNDIYAFQAVSATDLLIQALASSNNTNAPLGYPYPLGIDSSLEIEDELSTLNYYLNMLEQFLGNSSSIVAETVSSDNPNYQVQLVYTAHNLLNEVVVYNLYYNELSISSDILNEELYFEDPLDEHIIYLLHGEMTSSSVTYLIEGKKFIVNGEEFYTLRSFEDTTNYVSVEYTKDTDSVKKFFYSVVNNNTILNKSKIQIESIDNQIISEIDFIEGIATGHYTLTQKTDSLGTFIDVDYSIETATMGIETGKIRIEVITDPLTLAIKYVYLVNVDGDDEEHEFYHDRDDDFEDDDDDDDDDDDEDDD